MITLAIDNFQQGTGRPLPNGMDPAKCANDDFATSWPWLDYPRLFYYLKESAIPVEVKHTPNAPEGSWYPITIGWYDFSQDYFELINPLALEKNMKIVFLYHEADNPKDINRHLTELANKHNYHNIAFISGNSAADQYQYTHYWPELEYMYRRSVDFTKASKTHFKRRSKHYTALCRIDKLWRKLFMSNLWEQDLHLNGYFSYCQEQLGHQDDWDGVPLLNEWITERLSVMAKFVQAGPFFVDSLTTDQRNDYSVLAENFYEDSYFNIVLETFIDVDSSGGQFITEKTFKPILHHQPFIVVAEHNHLKHLHELGYKTFSSIWDESYDSIENTQERFEAVMKLSEDLCSRSLDQLHDMYASVEDILEHNHNLLKGDLSHRLKKLTTDLNSI